MPHLLTPKLFEDKDLSIYDEKDIRKNSKSVFKDSSLEIKLKLAAEESIWDEHNIFMTFKNKMIAIMEFWTMEINGVEIPKVKNATVIKEFRGKGFGTILYKQLFSIYGILASDLTLNGNRKIPNGSYGLWLDLMKENSHYIFDEIDNKFITYSNYKAFSSVRKNDRRIIIIKNDWIKDLLNVELTVKKI